MYKYLLIGICSLAILIFIIFIMPRSKKTSKELELTYEMNAGIPFKRIYEIEDESIVSSVKSYVSKNENYGAITGASVYTTYVFKGLKEGITTITFKVVSIDDDNDVMSEDKNVVKVDKDLNITLVEEENDN